MLEGQTPTNPSAARAFEKKMQRECSVKVYFNPHMSTFDLIKGVLGIAQAPSSPEEKKSKAKVFIMVTCKLSDSIGQLKRVIVRSLKFRKRESLLQGRGIRECALVLHKTGTELDDADLLSTYTTRKRGFKIDVMPKAQVALTMTGAELRVPIRSFQVVKQMRFGRNEPRILKLTGNGIVNVRVKNTRTSALAGLFKGADAVQRAQDSDSWIPGEATLSLRYSDVLYSFLEDNRTVVLEFWDSKLKYVSNAALEICELVNARVRRQRRQLKDEIVRRVSKERSRQISISDADYIGVEAPSARSLALIQQLKAAGDKDTAPLSKKTLLLHPKSTYTKSHHSVKTRPAALTPDGRGQVHRKKAIIEAIASRLPQSLPGATGAATPRPKHTKTLSGLTGDSILSRLRFRVKAILTDPTEVEGKARNRFFTRVRQRVIKEAPETICQVTRQFLTSMVAYVLRTRGTDLVLSNATAAPSIPLRQVVEACVESVVVVPLYRRLLAPMCKLTEADDARFRERVRVLRRKPQEWFGVPRKFVSADNWLHAVCELSQVEARAAPGHKLRAILACARAIYRCVSGRGCSGVLVADDFFPIFVFVVVSAGLRHPNTTKAFLWGVCSKSQLEGEGGYYLTVFEAAIAYVSDAVEQKLGASASRYFLETVRPAAAACDRGGLPPPPPDAPPPVPVTVPVQVPPYIDLTGV